MIWRNATVPETTARIESELDVRAYLQDLKYAHGTWSEAHLPGGASGRSAQGSTVYESIYGSRLIPG